MRGAASLHDHYAAGRQCIHEPLKLPARQPFALDDPTRTIRDGDLEHVLCQIHGDSRSIHRGLLLVAWSDPRIHGDDAAKEPGGVHAITGAVAATARVSVSPSRAAQRRLLATFTHCFELQPAMKLPGIHGSHAVARLLDG